MTLKFIVRVKFASSTSHINWLLFDGIIHLCLNHLRNSFEIIFLHGLHFADFNSCMLSIAVEIIFWNEFFHLGWILSTSFFQHTLIIGSRYNTTRLDVIFIVGYKILVFYIHVLIFRRNTLYVKHVIKCLYILNICRNIYP